MICGGYGWACKGKDNGDLDFRIIEARKKTWVEYAVDDMTFDKGTFIYRISYSYQ